ncbi:MAG: hypothetical protein AAB821_02350 [Patescibacteria group bacterium]
MTQYQYAKSIKSEVDDLNRIIDQKIIRGLSYRRESLRHKKLIREMRGRRTNTSWRSIMSFVSLF